MLKFADIFASGMTLQREMPVRLFGTSEKDCEAQVFLNGKEICSVQIPSGEFEIIIPAQPALFDSVLAVKCGEEEIVFENVDFGEVWIAGGQSNMEFLLKFDFDYRKNKGEIVPDAHHRFYDVPEYAHQWQADFNLPNSWGVWRSLNSDDAPYMSAVGKYFAELLRAKYPDVPVAIVGCNWGGTVTAAWTDIERLKADPELAVQVAKYEEDIRDFDFEAGLEAERKTKTGMANADGMMDKILIGEFNPVEKLVFKIGAKLLAGKITNVKLTPFSENRPAGLYDNMLMKIKGYTAKGVIWYQGESDDVRAEIYDKCFGTMIESWRAAWGYELPFLFVQLAPFGSWFAATGEKYPVVRAMQEKASKTVSGCYMASIMDVGDEDDIHPKQKKPVGERLALLALGHIYKEDIECDAPELDKAVFENGVITLSFGNLRSGLSLKGKKINALELFADSKPVKKFSAALEGNKIIIKVPASEREKKLRVEYCNTAYCEANIHTAAGLTIKPFAVDAE